MLFSADGANTTDIVDAFSADQDVFFDSFVASMIKMGDIRVLTGSDGEIRANCRRVNGDGTRVSSGDLVAKY